MQKDAAANGGSFELVALDLASLKSVRACADELLARGEAFDVVIANAGVMATPFGHTVDGFETQFGTNHLGHFVLVNRIAPLIRAGGIAEPLAMSTVSEMSEKAPLWDSMVGRYGLHATPYEQIANWAFLDWMLNFREETIQSTIKIRQAGFADCIDTHQSFRRQLTRLRDLRIIP